MGYIEGLLGGFLNRKYDVEAENRRQSELSSAREQSIFKTLLESPDPETQHLAIAGLLDSANPRRKAGGLRGWIGETQASPYLEQIRNLSPTVPVQEEYSKAIPSVSAEEVGQILPQEPVGEVQPTISQAPPQPSAAMPSSSLVQPGAQAPPPVSYTTRSPADVVQMTRTAFRPRQVLMSPEQKQFTQAIAGARGVVEGRVAGRVAAGMSREEALQLERQLQRGALRFGEGDVTPDATSPTGYSREYYNPTDPNQVVRRPAPAPTSTTRFFGQDLESISLEPEFGGIPYRQQSPAGAAKVNAEKQRREVAQASAVTGARGAAANQTKLNAPLPANVAAEQGVPFGTSMTDLKGIIPLTDDQRKRHDAATALAPQIQDIARLIPKVFPASTGLKGAAQASQVLAAKRIARDPDMAILDEKISLAVGNISRVLAAESGRLTEQDVIRAQKALVDMQGWTDTQESALVKLADIEKTLQKVASDLKTPGDVLRQRQGGPPNPSKLIVPNVFMGADGQLHTGSPTGPLYKPGG